MANFLAPILNDQQVDANGDPLSGGTVEVYVAGSSAPATTYSDPSGLVPNTWPIVLNTLGLNSQGAVWITGGIAYKYVIKDAAGVVQRTIDNVSGINDASLALDQWVVFQGSPVYISGTSFSVAGDQTDVFQVSRRIKTANSGGTVYGTVQASIYSSPNTTVTVIPDSPGALDSGLSQVSLGLITPENTSLPALYLSMRNRVINGNFNINQRNWAGTVNLSAGVYGHDRWKAGSGGATYTFAASGADTTLTISAGTLQQVIEGSNLEGGTFTLSWTGTAQGKIGGGSLSSSPVSGTVTAGADLTIEFSTGTLGTVQLEAGSVATTFERRPIALEMAMCRRYFQLAQFTVYKGSTGTNFAGSLTNVYFERMRATPTVGSTNRIGGTSQATTFTPESPTNMISYYTSSPSLDTWTKWQVQLDAEL